MILTDLIPYQLQVKMYWKIGFMFWLQIRWHCIQWNHQMKLSKSCYSKV